MWNRGALLAVLLLIIAPVGAVFAQAVCSPLVAQALQVVGAGCSETGRNEACYGNTQVSVAFQDNIQPEQFQNSGDLVELPGLKSLTTEPFDASNDTWGIAILRVLTAFPETTNLTMVLLGDTEINNDGEAETDTRTCEVKPILDLLTDVYIYSTPHFDSSSEPLDIFDAFYISTANGRSADSQWISIDNESQSGWIPAENVNLACTSDFLNPIDDASVVTPAAPQLQAFTLQNGSAESCSEAPNGLLISAPAGTRGSVNVNDVRLDFSSAGFLNAVPDGNLTVNGLQGAIDVTSFGQTVTVYPGFLTTVPLNGLVASGPPTIPKVIADLHNSPPLRDALMDNKAYDPNKAPLTVTTPIVSLPPFEVQQQGAAAIAIDLDIEAVECPPPAPLPRDVVLVLDVSGSMDGSPLANAKQAALNFVAQLDPDVDQLGLVTFNESASVETVLGQDFEEARRAISGLSAGGGTAIDRGLAAAEVLIRTKRTESLPVVVLFSDGVSNPQSALQVANQIKGEGTRLISLGLGDVDTSLMSGIATSPQDSLVTQSAEALSTTFIDATGRFNGVIAATNLTMIFRVDTEHYQLIDDYVLNGNVIAPGVIQLRTNTLWDQQQLRLQFFVRPLGIGDFPVGTLEYAYIDCNGTLMLGQPVPSGAIHTTETLTDTTITPDQIMTPGLTGEATIDDKMPTYWLIDVPSEAPFTLELDSGNPYQKLTLSLMPATEEFSIFEAFEAALLGGVEDVTSTDTGNGSIIYNFNDVQPGLYVAEIYNDTEDNPAVQLPIQFLMNNLVTFAPETVDGTLSADAPERSLTFAFMDDENTYALENITSDYLTITCTLCGEVKIVSSDGQEAEDEEWLDYMPPRQFGLDRTLYRLHGAAPYYMIIAAIDTSVQIDNGDTLHALAGSFSLEEGISANSALLQNLVYEFQVDESGIYTFQYSGIDGFAPSVGQTPDINDYTQRLQWEEGAETDNGYIAVFDLSLGTYYLGIVGYGDYSVSVQKGNQLESAAQSIVLDETVPGDTGGTAKVVEYTLDAPTDSLVTLVLQRTPTPGTYTDFEMTDSDGDPVVDYSDNSMSRRTFERGAGTLYYVLPLRGTPPFTIRFTVTGHYSFTIYDGDKYAADLGTLAVGETIGLQLPNVNNVVGTYSLSNLVAGHSLAAIIDTAQSSEYSLLNISLINGTYQQLRSSHDLNYENKQTIYRVRASGIAPYWLELSYNSNGVIPVRLSLVDLDTTISAQLNIESNNLHRGPSMEYSNVTVVYADQTLNAVSRSGDGSWIMVLTEDNLLGWVNASTLVPVDSNTSFDTLPINHFDGSATLLPDRNPGDSCTGFTIEDINLRTGPSENYPIIDTDANYSGSDGDIIGQAITNGQTWYLMGDGSWIRRDLFNEFWSDCSSLPLVVLQDGEIMLADETTIGSPTATDQSNIIDSTTETSPSTTASSACTVSANSRVNRRSGAGTNFATVGTLTSDQAVIASTTSDGYTWYQLADQSWIRSDVVVIQGTCPEA